MSKMFKQITSKELWQRVSYFSVRHSVEKMKQPIKKADMLPLSIALLLSFALFFLITFLILTVIAAL